MSTCPRWMQRIWNHRPKGLQMLATGRQRGIIRGRIIELTSARRALCQLVTFKTFLAALFWSCLLKWKNLMPDAHKSLIIHLDIDWLLQVEFPNHPDLLKTRFG